MPTRASRAGYWWWAAALNIPFVLCHPGAVAVEFAFLRSLAINAVLFLAPGLPVAGALWARGWRSRFALLWVMAFSFAVFLASLLGFHLLDWPITPAGIWNTSWLITNLGLLGNLALGVPATWGLLSRSRECLLGVILFALGYVLYFIGAVWVVPEYEDADFELQGTGHALLQRFEPLLLTDRNTVFYFAHPLLLHYYVAGSFLYYDQVDHLAFYDAASQRARAADRKETLAPPDLPVMVRGSQAPHRVVGAENGEYVVDPPLPNGQRRIPVKLLELHWIYDHFYVAPHNLETRTPNMFLASLTVAWLGTWIVRMTRTPWLAVLVAAAYATSPEVFVRASYIYTSISILLALFILMAVDHWDTHRDWPSFRDCALAAALAATANHKLLPLPIALAFWELVKPGLPIGVKRFWRAATHPALVGFVFGTAIFWTYGFTVDARAFWIDHVRYHLIDRIAHDNPLGYRGYPSALALWLEFWRHTGYLLLPMGIAALLLGLRPSGKPKRTPGLPTTTAPWVIWSLITGLTFSIVDWRQTKHLMPLMLPFHLAPARWAASRRLGLCLVALAFGVLLLWNLRTLYTLTVDFRSFTITPAW